MVSRRALFPLLLALLAFPATAPGAVPNRQSDPIVLSGADLPKLLGADPGAIVGFRHTNNRWQQIPVQVDERKLVDYADVRNGHQTAGRPFSHLAYADAGTRAGGDPNAAFDGDDELAAMAIDTGRRAPIDVAPPNGVASASKTEVAIRDPLVSGPYGYDSESTRFIYLFRAIGSLDPAAGEDYVDYEFDLLSGDYLTTYAFSGVPGGDGGNPTEPPANPEDSSVTTSHYSWHLLSRWVGDGLSISAASASGTDILDGDKAQAFYGCGRSELTFSRGGGGFIANIDGPVRAIRSYIGANSGTYTQRDHIYYERAEVANTYLRVHAGLAQLDQFLDYEPAADGMTYRNSAHPQGATIDGVPDPELETGTSLGPELSWEQTTGDHGTLTIMNRLETDMPGVEVGSFYHDDSTPTIAQCGGYADLEAHGSSGPAVHGSGLNSDPTLPGDHYDLAATRTIYVSGPGGDAALAEQRSEQVDAPLEAVEATAPARLLRMGVPRAKRLPVGKRERVTVRVANIANAPVSLVRVCARAPRRLVRTGCAQVRNLAAGDSKRARVAVALRPRASGKRAITLRMSAQVKGIETVRGKVRIKPRG